MFTGFSPQAWKFFRDLKKNNRRPWFLQERGRYDRFVVEPATQLAQALGDSTAFRKLGLHCLRPEKALFRIHRDLRFSHDKSPYKTYNGLSLSRSGMKSDMGSFYLHLDPDEFFAGVGFYQLDSQLLQRFRGSIAEDPAAKKMLLGLRKAKLELITDDSLVRLPRGYEWVTDPVLQETLRLRHFFVLLPLTAKDLASKAVVGKIGRFLDKCEPFLRQGWALLDDWRAQGGDPQWQQKRGKETARRFALMEADF